MRHRRHPDQPSDHRTAAAGDDPVQPRETPHQALSDRELEVIRLVAQGLTNAEIGARLFISAGTVKNHLAKLDVGNRVGIAAWAGRRVSTVHE